MTDAAQTETAPQLAFHPSRMLAEWLAASGVSLAFTTYQAGKVFLIGTNAEERKLSIFERTFSRCMGLGVGERRFWMSSLYQLWRFENFLGEGERQDGYDAVYVPVEGRTTGDVDIHDVHPYKDGEAPIFVVTRFNCLATLDDRNSFAPVWMPPFIDRLAAEDRCHLNGLAMEGGEPAYVTCVARSNVMGGWRDHRMGGGLLLSVPDGEVVADGLSMPHSPRVHDGRIYLVQSGTGEFGYVDPANGRFEALCFLPGFARGITIIGNHAVIGVSRPRPERTFEGLALDDRLREAGAKARCMLAVVNLTTGDIEHSMEIDGVVQELYDVVAIRDAVRPKAIGFVSDEIRYVIRPGTIG